MNLLVLVCLGVLIASGAAAALWLLTARGLPDKAVGLDLILALTINGLAMAVALDDELFAADLVLVAALLGAVGALTVARFVERRGS